MDSSSINGTCNKNSQRRVKEELNKVKTLCKKKKKQEKQLRKKFKKAQQTAPKTRKAGFILNSSDEDDDKIKKPELSVIPVTKASSGESLRQLPLTTCKITVAQAPKNITDAVLDEQRNGHQNKSRAKAKTSKEIREKSPSSSPDHRRNRSSSNSKSLSRRRSPLEDSGITFRRGSFSRSPCSSRIISPFQNNSQREPEDVIKRRELREKYVHEIQKTKKKKINKWEIKSTLYIESDAFRDELYDEEFYEEEHAGLSNPTKSQTDSTLQRSTEKKKSYKEK